MNSEAEPTAEVRVIGRARTPWKRREDTPHQPVASPETEGILEIEEEFAAGLADLASFERIWIVFLFHRSRGWTARVKPPRGGPKRGIFATRAPDRPSNIGLTNAVLSRVDVSAGRVWVRGIDLLDDTPILDLKPYLPMVDRLDDASHGWLEEFLEAGVEPKLKKPYRPPR